jgi:hypothetical protein
MTTFLLGTKFAYEKQSMNKRYKLPQANGQSKHKSHTRSPSKIASKAFILFSYKSLNQNFGRVSLHIPKPPCEGGRAPLYRQERGRRVLG